MGGRLRASVCVRARAWVCVFVFAHARACVRVFGLTNRQGIGCFRIGRAVWAKHGVFANVRQLERVRADCAALGFLGRPLPTQKHSQIELGIAIGHAHPAGSSAAPWA